MGTIERVTGSIVQDIVPLIQGGSFGLIVFLTVWFVRTGFPRLMDVAENSITRVLAKIDAIEERCCSEREAANAAYREEAKEVRDAFAAELKSIREQASREAEADRVARHKTANDFTEIVAKLFMERGMKKE